MTPVTGRAARAAAGRQPRHEPIFLLAPPRSYSTVSVALLAGHPEIYGFPEMLLFTADTVGGLLGSAGGPGGTAVIGGSDRLSGVLRAVSDLLEASQDSWATGLAEEWLARRSEWSPADLMDYLLGLVYPKIGLEKSPDTVASDEALDACLDRYPRSRYLHLTRHPASTMRSMLDYWHAFDRHGKRLVAFAASSWYCSHVRIVRKLRQLPAGSWLRIRAEDLVGDPASWLPGILDWLGLPHDDETVARMMQTQNWRFAGTGKTGELLGGDAKFMRSPALRPVPDPAEAVFDPSWGLTGDMRSRMISLASYLGY